MAAWKLAPAIGAGNCVVLEAGRIDPDLHPDPDGTDRRHAAAGRAQHRQRLRPRSRHAARHQQAHRQDRLHRLDLHRPRHRPGRRQQPDSGHAGTGRQVAQHLLRRHHGQGRRLPRQGHRRPGAVRLQPGRSLHLPEPRPDPGIDLRQVHGARPEARRGDQAGQPARHRQHDGCPGLAGTDDQDPCPTSTSASRKAPNA